MGEVAASFALLDFFPFFFFFFLAAAEVDGAAAVVAGSSSASGGDGGGVKTWTGSAAAQESVSEVEVIRWKSEGELRGIFLRERLRKMNGERIWTLTLALPPPRCLP